MTEFLPFSAEDFNLLFQLWRDCGFHNVGIVMGPLNLDLEVDIYRSTINIHAYDVGQVNPGTLEWYESKYIIFWCVYGLMRMNGLWNGAWETTHEFDQGDPQLYQEHFRAYEPHLRVQLPQMLEDPIIIENMWSYSYMKLYPQNGTSREQYMYPGGETTAWVDNFLNVDPSFCPEIL